MAGHVKTVALVVYIFCLAHPQHGIAWNLPSSPPPPISSVPSSPASYDTNTHGCPGSTTPFCGDSSSTTQLRCCDVVAHDAPTDFQAAVAYSGASSCADLTCQLCSAPSTTGTVNHLMICAASLRRDDNAGKGMSTTAKIALIGGGIILVLALLLCSINLRMIMKMVTQMILSNKNDQNINVNVDSSTGASAFSNSSALASSNAKALSNSKANAEATLEQRWVFIDGRWQKLNAQLMVLCVDPELLTHSGGPFIQEIE
ncbi:unnamed protein product [Urochloa humidicola]